MQKLHVEEYLAIVGCQTGGEELVKGLHNTTSFRTTLTSGSNFRQPQTALSTHRWRTYHAASLVHLIDIVVCATTVNTKSIRSSGTLERKKRNQRSGFEKTREDWRQQFKDDGPKRARGHQSIKTAVSIWSDFGVSGYVEFAMYSDKISFTRLPFKQHWARCHWTCWCLVSTLCTAAHPVRWTTCSTDRLDTFQEYLSSVFQLWGSIRPLSYSVWFSSSYI